MHQPCTSMVQRWGAKGERNGPRAAVLVKRDGCRRAALLWGHTLSRLWVPLRWITFKRLTYICWRAARRRLLTTAVPPREKACKRRCARELKPLRTPLPAPARQTAHRLCKEQDFAASPDEGLLFALLASFGFLRRGGMLQEVAQTSLPIF